MWDRLSSGQVVLANRKSALSVLHQSLMDATACYPCAFGALTLTDDLPKFRRHYPQILSSFEALRLASPDRADIARRLITQFQAQVAWRVDSSEVTLSEAMMLTAPPLRLLSHSFPGESGWVPDLAYQGRQWEASNLAELSELLLARNVITHAAMDSLKWLCNNGFDQQGRLNLGGRKIAVLGAGAEMAPTRLWLEAGAHVLWLDTRPPPKEWFDLPALAGRLSWSSTSVDLLTQPQAVLATLIDFADGAPIDLGLYAYAPGQAREVRLTASMNAVVEAMPSALLGSVTLLVSPTTPTALNERDLAAMQGRLGSRAGWETWCDRLGLLGANGGAVREADLGVIRSVVSIQGGSYQLAQYLGKVLQAQQWAEQGQTAAEHPTPLRVSANTAAITRTRSLDHPVFAAAFGGAAAMGVETLTPSQSRALNGLLTVHDWLHPRLPTPGLVRLHGGIHTLPYPLESALRVAAAIGFARRPRLLAGLLPHKS